MDPLRKFVTISLVLHAIVIIALIDVGLTGRKSEATDVYSVSIVAGAPSSVPSAPAEGTGKKYIYNRNQRKATLGEVMKERGLRESAPEISPRDIKPEEPVDRGPETASATPQRGQGTGPAGGSPSDSALWKLRVRGIVEMLWKTPPEIETMDLSLRTTYLLRVSRSGELLQKKLMVSSGNLPFDRSVLNALNRVNRFPPPPPGLSPGEDTVEVIMNFSPPKGA